MSKLDFEIKNDLSELARVNELLEEFGQANHFSSSLMFHLTLALEEILTNIIFYGYEGAGEQRIQVQLEFNDGEVSARIEDQAKAFNPLERESPDIHKPLEERTVGGLGIHIVRNIMDSVEYQRANDKNILTIKKKI